MLLVVNRCYILQFHGSIKFAADGLVTGCKTERPDLFFTGWIDGVTLIRRDVNQISWRDSTGFVLDLDHTAAFKNEIPLVGIVKMRFGLAAGVDLKVIDKFEVGSLGLFGQRPSLK